MSFRALVREGGSGIVGVEIGVWVLGGPYLYDVGCGSITRHFEVSPTEIGAWDVVISLMASPSKKVSVLVASNFPGFVCGVPCCGVPCNAQSHLKGPGCILKYWRC